MKKYALLALLLCLALCLPALASAEGEPKLDIIMLIDTTGSMTSNINNAKNQLTTFSNILSDYDVRYALIAFGDQREGDLPTPYTAQTGTMWTSDVDELMNTGFSSLKRFHGGDTPETSTNAITYVLNSMTPSRPSTWWRDQASRLIVLITDAEPVQPGEYDMAGSQYKLTVPTMDSVIDLCKREKVTVSLADYGNIASSYSDLVSQTGGISQRVSGSSSMDPIAQWIHDTPIVITQPVDCYVHHGDENAQFFAETLSKNNVKYTWYGIRNNKEKFKETRTTSGSDQFDPIEITYVSPNISGTVFHCVFTNSAAGDGRSVESNKATLYVYSAFDITGQPQDVTTDAGQTATFTVGAKGDGLTYQWQKQSGEDWVDLYGKTDATLSIPTTLADDGSVYRCVVKDAISDKQPGGYTLTSESATLTVVAAPAITKDPLNVITEAGKKAVFTVQATGTGLKYQWQQQNGSGWADLFGETGTSLTVTATTENSGSVYRCQVTSSYNTVLTSRSAALTVLSAPAIAQQPESVIVMEGEDASITVAATGDGLKYQWQVYRSGVWMDCIGEESPTLTLSGVTLADDGLTYRCVITSSYGTKVTSDAVTLTVLAKPEPPQTGDASRPLLWLTLLGASLLAMVMLRRRRA